MRTGCNIIITKSNSIVPTLFVHPKSGQFFKVGFKAVTINSEVVLSQTGLHP